jgi:circadian clock protein KaiB
VTPVIFTVYVAGRSPHSLHALANLRAFCSKYFEEAAQIEIVDILEEPRRALDDGVLLTPSVVRVSPGPRLVLVGNLGDQRRLEAALSQNSAPGQT